MISILQNTIKEKKRRIEYKNSEQKRRYYKFLNIQAPNIGYQVIKTLNKNRSRNFCLVSGHARSIYSRKFRLSRHQIKKYFSYVTGLRNASW